MGPVPRFMVLKVLQFGTIALYQLWHAYLAGYLYSVIKSRMKVLHKRPKLLADRYGVDMCICDTRVCTHGAGHCSCQQLI